ncbi:MAG: hypothetical protein SGARI_000767 [Bacillariaceae sp.]
MGSRISSSHRRHRGSSRGSRRGNKGNDTSSGYNMPPSYYNTAAADSESSHRQDFRGHRYNHDRSIAAYYEADNEDSREQRRSLHPIHVEERQYFQDCEDSSDEEERDETPPIVDCETDSSASSLSASVGSGVGQSKGDGKRRPKPMPPQRSPYSSLSASMGSMMRQSRGGGRRRSSMTRRRPRPMPPQRSPHSESTHPMQNIFKAVKNHPSSHNPTQKPPKTLSRARRLDFAGEMKTAVAIPADRKVPAVIPGKSEASLDTPDTFARELQAQRLQKSLVMHRIAEIEQQEYEKRTNQSTLDTPSTMVPLPHLYQAQQASLCW